MARLANALIVVGLFVIFFNVWTLSRRPTSSNADLSQTSKPSDGQGLQIDPSQQGASQNKESPTGDGGASQGAGYNATAGNAASNSELAGPQFSQADYDIGMEKIKSILDRFTGMPPGIESLRGEDRYNRRIKPDTDIMEGGELPPTSAVLGMYLKVTDEEVETLRRSHASIMKELPDSIHPNAAAGRGIAMTGGGMYFPMLLTAVRWLREHDKTTPIEVYMADRSEYEPHICEELFPKINAECRILREIYGPQLSDKLKSDYALKPLAILASKFDDIYFMDADSYPLKDVSSIFDWSIYKERGYVLNADYWPRYISPKFYDVVGIKLGGRARGEPGDCLVQSDRKNAVPGRSTESGQIFVRKSAHIKSLMLAMYYNLYSDVYYPLLMQDGHGEGDKDTFVAAATICNETYYQTQQRPPRLSSWQDNGEYKGFAMVQPDPRRDYEHFEERRADVKPLYFALHANAIKSNPKYLLQTYHEPSRGMAPLRKQRFFGSMDNVRREMSGDVDVELRLFRTMEAVACEWALADGFCPLDWQGEDVTRLCRILHKHVAWLAENPDVDFVKDSDFWIDVDQQDQQDQAAAATGGDTHPQNSEVVPPSES